MPLVEDKVRTLCLFERLLSLIVNTFKDISSNLHWILSTTLIKNTKKNSFCLCIVGTERQIRADSCVNCVSQSFDNPVSQLVSCKPGLTPGGEVVGGGDGN